MVYPQLKTFSWSLGDLKPESDNYDVICVLQANGAEASDIYRRFENIPRMQMLLNPRFIVWKGEIAQFIFDNL